MVGQPSRRHDTGFERLAVRWNMDIYCRAARSSPQSHPGGPGPTLEGQGLALLCSSGPLRPTDVHEEPAEDAVGARVRPTLRRAADAGIGAVGGRFVSFCAPEGDS